MIEITVILDGVTYHANDDGFKKKNLKAFLLAKGVKHIFKYVVEDFKGHQILATWNEDQSELTFSSNTISTKDLELSLQKHNNGIRYWK